MANVLIAVKNVGAMKGVKLIKTKRLCNFSQECLLIPLQIFKIVKRYITNLNKKLRVTA